MKKPKKTLKEKNNPENASPSPKRRIKPFVKTMIYFALLILVNLLVVNITFISGESMTPTLRDRQIALVLKAGRHDRPGTIVITDRKNPLEAHLVKRIIATEGQHLVIRDREIYVDGEKLEEPYLAEKITYEEEIDMIIPAHSLFLMGDNRAYSVDSRQIGVIDTKNIIGQLILY